MGPLSITASIVALAQASGFIGKIVSKLCAFSKARAEFCDLLNEIGTLQAVLLDVETTLRQISHRSTMLPVVGEPRAVLSIQQELDFAVKEMDELATRLLTGSKGLDADGLHRISKLQWAAGKGKCLAAERQGEKRP